jgi:hypothetical protein
MTNGTNGNGNAANKDTVYIDLDDEITGVIDKVRGSEHRIVALVLPKRAAAFQSIVNMRLLKRTADNAKKHVVLITSDTTVTPLAGVVGLHVAKNLQSRPEIPPAPAGPGALEDEAEEIVDMAGESPSNVVRPDRNKSVGDLASAAKQPDDDDLPIELDNTEPLAAPAGNVKPPKGKKDKKLKVPNFGKFRKLLIFGGIGLAALIILIVLCAIVLPKATITVKTDSIAVNSNLDLTLNPNTTKANVDAGVVPAQSQQTQKTQTQQVDATGQRNDGNKASGSITVINCNDPAATIPAGTAFSANGKTFIGLSTITVPGSDFSSSGKCKKNGTASVNVMAQNGGADYNLNEQSYTVAGAPAGVTGEGSPMDGGTDKITKVVAQGDIDSAKQKISGQDNSAVKQELQSGLQSKGLYAIPATLNVGSPDITSTSKAGDAADSVTVTEKITYTMLGAKQTDLKKLIANSVNKQIDPTKQKILDYGLDKAVFNPQSSGGGNSLVTMQVTSVAGSALDMDSLKKQVAGKKAADAKSIIKSNPSVTDVDVKYSPFWVSSIPKKTSKITIQIEKPTVSNAKP